MNFSIIISYILSLYIGAEPIPHSITLLPKTNFEKRIDGKDISLYTIYSETGLTAQITNYGARLVSLWTPDKYGVWEDIAIGLANINDYQKKTEARFWGPIVGRYANRISKGKFSLDNHLYQITCNNNENSLHGGNKGFDSVVWNVEKHSNQSLTLSYISESGNEGFPGTVKTKITYTISKKNELIITYKATTDKKTIINLSHHGLYNLKGSGKGTITNHFLNINSSYVTAINKNLIPTGKLMLVNSTPFDFRKPKEIGLHINQNNKQIKYRKGYDHNWIIDKKGTGIEWVATIKEPSKGRVMTVFSDQPGLQFYSGNFFDGSISDKFGNPIIYRGAFALETQKYPDSPNHPHFPSTTLTPEDTYTHTCVYQFDVE